MRWPNSNLASRPLALESRLHCRRQLAEVPRKSIYAAESKRCFHHWDRTTSMIIISKSDRCQETLKWVLSRPRSLPFVIKTLRDGILTSAALNTVGSTVSRCVTRECTPGSHPVLNFGITSNVPNGTWITVSLLRTQRSPHRPTQCSLSLPTM